MGKDSNSKKPKATEPYPMGGVKDKGGLGAEGQSSQLTAEQRQKRKKKKHKQGKQFLKSDYNLKKTERKQLQAEAPATEEALTAGEESEVVRVRRKLRL
ncbi:hypothetical protein FRC07_001582 [Ceratobasidium sp. 392]|nr:hypothetical protein FRC07_001582 [Ceratobasidium sp. 392]